MRDQALVADNSKGHDASVQLLPHWAPVTSRLLECGGSMAWNVIDQVISKPDDFVKQLHRELEQPFLRRLQPARTQGQVQEQEILSLLTQFANSTMTATTTTTLQPKDDLGQVLEHVSHHPHDTVRGDESAFISREERCRSEFIKSHPYLMQLLQTVEGTVLHHLSHSIHFDKNETSVQLAVYPGDGRSGYPRHCDREFCQEETAVTTARTQRRIITCVYYLTPDDWNVELDGGCLRLYNNTNSEWFDVAPYSNRLVIFRSDGVEHQVLPSWRRPRTALTIWLYGSVRQDKLAPVMKMLPSNQFDGSMMNAHVNKELLGPPPLSVTKGLHNAPSKIFVSIAAYRDSEIAPTLLSLMTTAQHSDRIFVGLVLQIDTITTQNNEDEQIVDSLQQLALTTPWYNTHVRTMTLDARHAQGPCYARYLCQSLHRGEDYVLQIDSHMRFRNNWDTFLIEQLQTCSLIHKNNNKNKVMLTTYPVGYQLPNLIPNECRATLLVPWKFDAQGMLRQQGRLLLSLSESSNPKDPIPCLLYAAGFNFTYASVLDDCPYQMLPHLFFGEELSMALRLYTWGYDLYAPSESVCYHLWSRAHRPTSPLLAVGETEADKQAARDRSQRIVKEQLAGRGPGLGSERCAHEFAKALKVDFEKHRLEEGAGLGGMSISSFVASEVIASADKLEKSVFQLERNAQSLIASFLKQLE